MSIKELAELYWDSVQLLKGRRADLRLAARMSRDDEEIAELKTRHAQLQAIERDVVVIAKKLDSYVRHYDSRGVL